MWKIKLFGVVRGHIRSLEIAPLYMIQYDTIRYIYVRSKADDMASLVYRTAQKLKNKEKLKTKTE